MRTSSLLVSSVLYSVCAFAHATPRDSDTSAQTVCQQLQAQLSKASAVFQPGSTSFADDVDHYFNSSAAASTCSVEPGSTADVGKLLQIVGKNRVPFGIKGGGHTGNPGFSSSTGIQVAMTRFDEVVYHPNNGTVDIGTGLIWDVVYATLDPLNVTVAGGRVSGVGVGGFSLGGGLNYFGNEVGFSVDNIVRAQVVLPSGQVVTASADTNSDLFFGVRGGYNNFGIVTQLTYKAINIQDGVWGGLNIVSGDQIEAVTNATLKYVATVTDQKAALVVQYMGTPGQALPVIALSLFYDGPAPPPGIFDDFIALPAIVENISGPRGLSPIVQATNSLNSSPRGNFNTAALQKASPAVVNAVVNETIFWTQKLANTSLTGLSISIDAFLLSMFQHAAPGSSAYPPNRALSLIPSAISFQWNDTADDVLIAQVTTEVSQHLTSVAAADGQDVNAVAVYGNYASSDTWTAQRLFGASLPRLQTIKKKYDPGNVMSLTGGWKVTA